MEIVAMDLKLRGMYIARQLSFHGVSFRIEEVPLDEDIKHVYDESVKLVSRFFIFGQNEIISFTSVWSWPAGTSVVSLLKLEHTLLVRTDIIIFICKYF